MPIPKDQSHTPHPLTLLIIKAVSRDILERRPSYFLEVKVMNNKFRDDELVTVQGKAFPVIGGRLRIVHEDNQSVSIRTELVSFELDHHAIVRATVETGKGTYTGTGVATAARDPKLTDALLELAETRAVARSLRYAGIGPECCGAEELGDGAGINHESENGRQQLRVVSGGRVAADAGKDVNRSAAGQREQPRPVSHTGGGNGSGGNGGRGLTVATAAQLRAIRTLARQVGTSPEKVCQRQYGHGRVEGLTVREASALIDKLKTDASQPVA